MGWVYTKLFTPTRFSLLAGGNIFGLIVKKIVQLIARLADDAINGVVIDPVNNFLEGLPWPLSFIGRPFPRACISGPLNPPRHDCVYGAVNDTNLLGCLDISDQPAQQQCYFTRQATICLDNGDKFARYKELFEGPDAAQLEQKYKEIAGDSFEFLEPTFKQLLQTVASSTPDWDVTEAKDTLCDASLFESMDLDQIIVVCLFTFIKSFC